jgi:aspartate carbamoyltransferase catalytic subunit
MNRGLEISADAADAAEPRDPRPGLRGVAVRMAVLYHLLAGEGWRRERPAHHRGPE